MPQCLKCRRCWRILLQGRFSNSPQNIMILRLVCSRQNSTRMITGRQRWDYSKYFNKSSISKQQWSEDDFDFGTYSVILPSEPYVFGVSHIIPRSVPPNIVRPPYALSSLSTNAEDFLTATDGGKIMLGGEAEGRLRAAARLAKKVREYAGKLVQVCISVLS